MTKTPEQLVVKNFPAKLRNRLRLEALSRNVTMALLLTQIVEEWISTNGTVSVSDDGEPSE